MLLWEFHLDKDERFPPKYLAYTYAAIILIGIIIVLLSML